MVTMKVSSRDFSDKCFCLDKYCRLLEKGFLGSKVSVLQISLCFSIGIEVHHALLYLF